MIAEDSRQLPRQVYRVADAGVHPLPAHRTVDVRGITKKEHTAPAELIRDAVVHAVGREPAHALT